MSNKLLSICIPTYNRSEVLDETLNKLFSNPDFDPNQIEVIISDNCSTDDTEQVVSKYPLIKYYKNDVNVKDLNFTIALSHATGEYIKLQNDTVIFKEGFLKKMLKIIEENVGKNINLFFYLNTFSNLNCEKQVSSGETFIKQVSFYSTWISNFGIWRKDFVNIENKNRYVELQFLQVDWSYKIVNNNLKTLIYFQDFYDVIIPNNKGGYNIFDTFINKYLYIVKEQKFTTFIYEIEKFRLFRYFVYGWLREFFIKNSNIYTFETKGVYKLVLYKYWYNIYIYPLLSLLLLKRLFKKIIKSKNNE